MKRIIAITFFMLLLAGCAENNIDGIPVDSKRSPDFYATIEDPGTKTYVDRDMTLRWTKGDRVSIFAGNTYNQEYKFVGETGANNGAISALSVPGFVAADKLNANYAVYPYSASNEIDNYGNISVVLPAVQQYAENSFGPEANTMVAATEDKSDMTLQFRNLCGYLVVKLYGEGTVSSVMLEGNNGEKISGRADIQASYGTLPSIEMAEDATTSITIDCGDGVTLGTTAETATEFWFCVPPVTFNKGFTVTATKTDGWQMVKSTSSSKEVVRNTRNALTPIEAVFNIPSVEVIPPDDEIWYITKDNQIVDLEASYKLYNDKPFDVNVVSHTYSNGKGIIKCDGPIKVLNDFVFGNDYFRNIIGIFLPNSVEILEIGALRGISVSQLRIPDNLKLVECYALNSGYLEKFIGKNVSEDGRCLFIEDGYAPGYATRVPIDEGYLVAFAPAGISSYTIPDNVKHLGRYAFAFYEELHSITFNEGLESIRGDCFDGTHLDCDIVLPQSLKSLDAYAFQFCTGIKGFYGNDKFHTADNRCLVYEQTYGPVTWHGRWIARFVGDDITDYVIPEGIKGVENYTFDRLNNLKSITFPSSITYITGYAFDNCPKLEAVYGYCTSDDHMSIVFGDEYGTLAVKNGVKEYNIPNGIKSIRNLAFCICPDLETVTMNDDVIELEGETFSQCFQLKKVIFSAGLKTIGGNPFLGCDNIKEVYFRSLVPPSYSDTQFYEMPNLKMYVPRQSLELYLNSSDWAQFRQYFEPYDYDDLPEEVTE